MKPWRLLMQLVGATALVLSVGGYYLLIGAVVQELRHPLSRPDVPFYSQAFFTLNAVDAIFLAGIVFASVGLLTVKLRAATIYTWLMLAMLIYEPGVGALWSLPDPIGRSIGAASGVGSMGSAPLILFPIPFVYPVLSVMLVNLAKYKLRPLGFSSPPMSSASSSGLASNTTSLPR